MLGLSLYIGVCGLVVILSYMLETLVKWCNCGSKRRQHAWNSDCALQVHRRLCEREGYGRWSHLHGDSPVCDGMTKFDAYRDELHDSPASDDTAVEHVPAQSPGKVRGFMHDALGIRTGGHSRTTSAETDTGFLLSPVPPAVDQGLGEG